MDVDAIKERNRWMWGLGDYAELSEALRPAAEALADACAVSAGQEVLDVAAGDGNFAIACAREGASVVASDLSPGMVERGRARSEREGYDIEWVEADVEDLPFEDGRFDCVGSVFGAMIAPRPRRGRRGAVPRRAPGRDGRHDGLDAARLLRRAVPARPQLRAAVGRAADVGRVVRRGRPCASASTGSPRASRSSVRTLPWRFDSPEEMVTALGHLGAAVGRREAEPAARALGAAHRGGARAGRALGRRRAADRARERVRR